MGRHRELIGKVTPVRYNPRTGFLDLQPASPTYATRPRLLERQLVARINGKASRTVVRDLRVLAPRALTTTGPGPQAEHHQAAEQPEAPVRTRDDVSAGHHCALSRRRPPPAARPSPNAAPSTTKRFASALPRSALRCPHRCRVTRTAEQVDGQVAGGG
ncbi:hypothetical protein [Kitasatospora sp. NPDC098663]|uniref:hypothetical protein n=1 Tax=Kitasatospora sp. NPDC098663 TaxID=3364096 RepID=UPI003829A20F